MRFAESQWVPTKPVEFIVHTGPGGGSDLLAILQLSALDGPLHLGSPDGPALAPLPLPYAIPVPAASNRPKL